MNSFNDEYRNNEWSEFHTMNNIDQPVPILEPTIRIEFVYRILPESKKNIIFIDE